MATWARWRTSKKLCLLLDKLKATDGVWNWILFKNNKGSRVLFYINGYKEFIRKTSLFVSWSARSWQSTRSEGGSKRVTLLGECVQDSWNSTDNYVSWGSLLGLNVWREYYALLSFSRLRPEPSREELKRWMPHSLSEMPVMPRARCLPRNKHRQYFNFSRI